MTVVPNQANDMMDIGRLQGFEVNKKSCCASRPSPLIGPIITTKIHFSLFHGYLSFPFPQMASYLFTTLSAASCHKGKRKITFLEATFIRSQLPHTFCIHICVSLSWYIHKHAYTSSLIGL